MLFGIIITELMSAALITYSFLGAAELSPYNY